MGRFALFTAASAIPLGAITLVLAFRPGGEQVVNEVLDIGQGIAALAAVVSCSLVARATTGRTRWAWGLLMGPPPLFLDDSAGRRAPPTCIDGRGYATVR
jgi:hypothetical protein